MNTDNTQPIHELDVRVWIPIKRHENLLKLFKELPVGESFIFINDHDPLPLYYEFRSIHGDVVGWEYLNKGGREWKVKVTRTEASKGREFNEIATLMDLRKIKTEDWIHVVFHRYGMMPEGKIMEIIADTEPEQIHNIFNTKFTNQFNWEIKKKNVGEIVIHITKKEKTTSPTADYKLIKQIDVRPYHSATRHDIFFQSFDELKPGESFTFINDHDPKPLYYQIEAESKEPFAWEYLQEGPEEWEVKVSKTL